MNVKNSLKSAPKKAAAGEAPKQDSKGRKIPPAAASRKIVATYEYTDLLGNVVFEVVRFHPKDFRVRRNLKDGSYDWKKPPVIYPYKLHEIMKATEDEIIFIVEGEKDVETLRSYGLIATCSPFGQGPGKFHPEWASYFAGMRVAIIPDNDKVGREHACRIYDLVAPVAAACCLLSFDLPDIKDVTDWFASGAGSVDLLIDLAEKTLKTSVAPKVVPAQEDEDEGDGHGDAWEGDKPAKAVGSEEDEDEEFKRLPFTPFPLHVLPEVIRNYVQAGAQALGVDPTYIALPALVAVGGTIGDARAIKLKDTWIEPSVFWGVLIAGSTTLKSPAQLLGVGPVKEIQGKRWKDYDAALSRYEVAMEEWKASGGKAPGKGTYASASPPQRPDPDRLVVQDITIEKLADILRMNSRGVILIRDELAAWFSSFGRYKTPASGTDLPNWLEIFQAHEITIDRKTGDRPTIHVPRALVSIIGTIQPSIFAGTLSNEHFSCGLASRLLLAMPPKLKKVWSEDTIPASVGDPYRQLLHDLHFRLGEEKTDDSSWPKLIGFTIEGKREWVRFYNEWAEKQHESEGDQAYALGKLEAYCARFALLFAVVERWASGEGDEVVAAEHVLRAEVLVKWFANEVSRVYAMVKQPAEVQESERVLDFIATLGGKITPRRLLRSNPTKYRTSSVCRLILSDLVDKGHGRWEYLLAEGQTVGRATQTFVMDELQQQKGGA